MRLRPLRQFSVQIVNLREATVVQSCLSCQFWNLTRERSEAEHERIGWCMSQWAPELAKCWKHEDPNRPNPAWPYTFAEDLCGDWRLHRALKQPIKEIKDPGTPEPA